MMTKGSVPEKRSEGTIETDIVGEQVAITLMERAIETFEQGIKDARTALEKLRREQEADDGTE
jgi:hypothetical protein